MAITDPGLKKRFLVDVNLGKLARWLRLLGYDTLFYRSISIFDLSRIAKSEGRIFLTRSHKNANKKLFARALLIRSSKVMDQLKELSGSLDLGDGEMLSRCSLCNNELTLIDKERIASLLPTYIYETHNEFRSCRKCGKIYWQGTHQKKILERMNEFLKQ